MSYAMSSLLRYLSAFFGLALIAFVCSSCEKRDIIAHDLDEREANEIIVFLSGRGIETRKEKVEVGGGGATGPSLWNISVTAANKREAMAILSQAGLPRRRGQSLLQLFRESGLVPSEMQQTIRYQAGLSEQIASVIRKIDGVIEADIQLSFPKEDPLNPEAEKGNVTASVYVKHNGVLNDPNNFLIQKIRELVAGAVPDLVYDNVTVVPDLARLRDIDILDEEEFKSGDVPLVSIWTLVMAKESVTRFRIIFFSFFVATLLLVVALAWLLWKIMPILSSSGGIKSLLSFSSLQPTAEKAKEEEKKKEEKPKEKDKEEDDEEEEDEELEDEQEEEREEE